MIVEIRGTQFGNKGAELMLYAITRHLRNALDGVTLVVEPSIGTHEQRCRYGLHPKMWNRRYGRLGLLLDVLMRPAYRKKYGLVTEREIDAVLDASGFAYGDAWGPENAECLAKNVRRWKGQGKRIVLLPQAMGPFTAPRVREAFRRALGQIDVVYARDAESLDHVNALGAGGAALRLAPDFTILAKGEVRNEHDALAGRACLVPNSRMLDTTSGEVRDAYLPFLQVCVAELQGRGLDPFVLAHQPEEDGVLVSQLVERCPGLQEVREADPLVLKGVIGRCAVVVASRYHAIAGALCQAVPVIGTSWSHKYSYLFRDFDCENCLVDVRATPTEIAQRIADVSEDPSRTAILSRQAAGAASVAERTRAMWAEVEALLTRSQ